MTNKICHYKHFCIFMHQAFNSIRMSIKPCSYEFYDVKNYENTAWYWYLSGFIISGYQLKIIKCKLCLVDNEKKM